jgi:hypothetical protein
MPPGQVRRGGYTKTQGAEAGTHRLCLPGPLAHPVSGQSYEVWRNGDLLKRKKGRHNMNSIFYVIGVVVVVLFFLNYFGLR